MTRARDVANIDGILTTTGDTFYASAAATPARLGVGSTGQVLTVASGVPSWTTPAAGGGMTLLSTTNLSGASVTVSGIDSTYINLFILCENYRTASPNYPLQVRFNSDTGSNYGYRNIYAGTYLDSTGESVAQYRGSLSDTKIEVYSRTLDTSSTNNAFTTMSVYNYTSTSSKMFNSDFWGLNSVNQMFTGTVNGIYKGTSAISSITVYTDSTFNGGTIKIYGVK